MSSLYIYICITGQQKTSHMGVSKNGGTQQPWVFQLKMIILGVLGVPPFKETSHIYS